MTVSIPNEIVLEILGHLVELFGFKELFHVRYTCKQWNSLIHVTINDQISQKYKNGWSVEVRAHDLRIMHYAKMNAGSPTYNDKKRAIYFTEMNLAIPRNLFVDFLIFQMVWMGDCKLHFEKITLNIQELQNKVASKQSPLNIKDQRQQKIKYHKVKSRYGKICFKIDEKERNVRIIKWKMNARYVLCHLDMMNPEFLIDLYT
ncbi:10849_t:CDS:2 [Acaulospora morrowiae]|uniref:10849_t:CDS:1 n=1 Tax=Acaulospora morrowiae TaxID=94023 RepID=A0A9N8YLM4_9GLOM|nr:10849_t:CDS:2 [Acaulospora morrowiae]